MIKNKAYNRYGNCFLFIFVMCLVLFNLFFAGCGLDVFYDIASPYVPTEHKCPDVSDMEVGAKVFRFNTNIIKRKDFAINGTDVYYKIYTNKDDFEKEKKDLLDCISSNIANSAEKMIGDPKTTNGYGYQRLNVSGNDFIVPCSNSPKDVSIRLTNYSDQYSAYIKYDGFYDIPTRYNGKSFDFGRVDISDKPKIDDKDLKGNSVPEDDRYYVCMFAVSEGHDSAYTLYYSNITYLGSVCIDSSERNN